MAIPEARPKEVLSQLRRLNELFMVECLGFVIYEMRAIKAGSDDKFKSSGAKSIGAVYPVFLCGICTSFVLLMSWIL